MRHLGQINAMPSSLALDAAGVSAETHTTLTWHERPEIERAMAEGRLVAEFVVRYGDPACYVVRKALD